MKHVQIKVYIFFVNKQIFTVIFTHTE